MGHKRANSTTEAETPKDGPTAASIRRERKRAIDRESQRLSRARTRTYIAQLEQTIEELNNSKTSPTAPLESSSVSISQLKQQCEENRRLKAMIGRIHRMTQEVAGDVPEPTSEERTSSDSPSNDAVVNHAVSDSSNSPAIDEEMHHEVPVAETAGVPSPLDFREQEGSPVFNDSLRNNAWHIALASITQDTGLLKNHFEEITAHLASLETSDPTLPYTSAEEDEDIVTRACLHGWGEARRRHSLDHVWIGIEALDQEVFERAKVVERVASLWLLRSMVMHRISPAGQPERRIPQFMQPTKIQSSVDHASIIDYFCWPDLRDALVLANAQFASDLSTAWFATHLHFEWKYRVQDICKFHTTKDLYSFSGEFRDNFADLSNWHSPFGSHDLNKAGPMTETFGLSAMDSMANIDVEAHLGLAVC